MKFNYLNLFDVFEKCQRGTLKVVTSKQASKKKQKAANQY